MVNKSVNKVNSTTITLPIRRKRDREALKNRYWGLFSEVARAAGVNRSVVTRHVSGEKRNRKVHRVFSRVLTKFQSKAA